MIHIRTVLIFCLTTDRKEWPTINPSTGAGKILYNLREHVRLNTLRRQQEEDERADKEEAEAAVDQMGKEPKRWTESELRQHVRINTLRRWLEEDEKEEAMNKAVKEPSSQESPGTYALQNR
jgi:hypothetical protein